jgi:hypothetical protein
MSGWDMVAMGFGVFLGGMGLLAFVVPVLWIISHYSHKVKLERMKLQAQTQGTEALPHGGRGAAHKNRVNPHQPVRSCAPGCRNRTA